MLKQIRFTAKLALFVVDESSLTVTSNKLANGGRSSSTVLHEGYLGNDDVVLQHGAAARAHSIPPCLVHINVGPTTVITLPHGHHQSAHTTLGMICTCM